VALKCRAYRRTIYGLPLYYYAHEDHKDLVPVIDEIIEALFTSVTTT
jgi:hypothetical protein